MRPVLRKTDKTLLVSVFLTLLLFLITFSVSGNKSYSDLPLVQKLLAILFYLALTTTFALFVGWLIKKFRNLLRTTNVKQSKKKPKQSAYTISMLMTAGTSLIGAGIIFNFGLLFYAGIVFGLMGANRYFTKYPRYRKYYKGSLTILFILYIIVVIAISYKDVYAPIR